MSVKRLAAPLIALTVWLIACNGPASPSGSTTSKSTSSASTVVQTLRISGPSTVAPDATAQFVATATMADGSQSDYTTKVSWRSQNSNLLTIAPTGLATGHAVGDVTVTANLAAFFAQTSVLVTPAGTFRLTGTVTESGLPVVLASVTVIAGQGTGASAATDYDGTYRLYGVAGPIQVQVSKAGYGTLVKATTVTSNNLLDFPDFAQTGALPSLAGSYTLTLQASDDCAVARPGFGGAQPPIPADERTRTYQALVTQTGPRLDVTLTGATFFAHDGRAGNAFHGRIEPGQLTFSIGDGYFYYLSDLDVVEQLSSGTLLAFDGSTEQLSPTPGVLHAAFGGTVFEFTAKGSSFSTTNWCSSANHQFTMTPAGRTARVRR